MLGSTRAFVILTVIIILGAYTSVAGNYGGARASSPPAFPPASPYLRTTLAGADVIVRANPTQNLDRSNPFGALAYQGSALAHAARLVRASDPARSRRYATVANTIASYLVRHDAMSRDHQLGWGRPGAWDAFGDGTTNPPYQVYAFQTGLVSAALLDTYAITANRAYLTTVESVMRAYLPFSTTRLDPSCGFCRMFWYSTNANDAGRYVKNTNVLMGWVMAGLYRITGKSDYRAYATQVYNEETYEIVHRGDYSYLGVNDRRYSRAIGPEAHIVLETYAYSQIAALLGLSDSQTRATFDRMVETFWQCGARCQATATPNAYSEFMSCYPASFDTSYAARCARLLTTPGLPHLSPFPLIGALYALPNLALARV